MSSLSRIGLAALALAEEHGWPVLPLHERRADGLCSCRKSHVENPKGVGKHPRIANGFNGASVHPEQIAAWWDRWPTANIGVWPGGAQLLVVDVDSPRGEAAARELGAFDVETLETITHRGLHCWFRLPAGVHMGNRRRDDFDIRAHDGYVLVPPSVHPSGHVYHWRGPLHAISPIPARLLEAMLPPSPAATPSASARPLQPPRSAPDHVSERRILAYAERVGYGLVDGRKTAAFQFACFLLHDVALTRGAAWAYLTTWNAHNAPPLSERKLEDIATNACRYGGRRGAA